MGNSISRAEHEAEVARFEQQLAESRRQIENVQQQMLQIQRANEDERKVRNEERVELLRQLDESHKAERKAHENADERAGSTRQFMEMMQKQHESQSQLLQKQIDSQSQLLQKQIESQEKLLQFMDNMTIEYRQSRHVMLESGRLTEKVEHIERRMVTKTGLIRELEHRQFTPQASVLMKNGDCKSDQGIPSIDSTPDDQYGSEDEMANSSSAAQWYNTNTWSKDYAGERSGPSNPTTLIKTIPPSTNKGDGDAQDTGEVYS